MSMKITEFTIENLKNGCVTDNPRPSFAFSVDSDAAGVTLERVELTLGSWKNSAPEQTGCEYDGEPLKPYTSYTATLSTTLSNGESASGELKFETGRMSEPWTAKWITDGSYKFTEKGTSPLPLYFKKEIELKEKVKSVKIYATALGIYELKLNGEKVGEDFFAPGFTSYKTSLQYQVYDITSQIKETNTLEAVVAGGWAVGAFVFTRKNRVTAPRQAFKAEIRIEYESGICEVIGTDAEWLVSHSGPLKFAEFYDGEIYDATVEEKDVVYKNATIEKVKIKPETLVTYGSLVRAHEVFKPVAVTKAPSGEIIYDFGQNLAGVVRFKVRGKQGQKITVRHAEVLNENGELFTAFLRSAKCKVDYICRDGEQSYMPRMTYMGYRYAGVSGIDESDILEIESVALYSDIEDNGSFECSNELVNRLQENIRWSSKSNFVDIPTDCPQRDERMGWTGDIAIFAQTACYNFDMARFLDKWLKDVRAEQTRGGGIPNTVPVQGYGFPATMPKKAIAFWGDASVFVPWALYKAYGDINVLKENYNMMKKYVKACRFWAGIGVGKHRYIWSDIPAMQFGDWVAPDVPKMGQWQARCKWTGTAALAASSGILAEVATLLGNEKDAKKYARLSAKVKDAYVSIFTDGNGKLKEEFQTAYVLPLYFDMFPGEQREKAADNLVGLIEKNDYCIGTGFPGTPYILFALSDSGHADVAYKMLLNTKCPSWLYEVKAGATTVWERWDGLDPDGVCRIADDGTGGMVSYNHYGFGSVGDFLYRRIAGIEPVDGGYKSFKVAPVLGGDLAYAKGKVKTPYGDIVSDWKVAGGKFTLKVKVPVSTSCEAVLPNGESTILKSGEHILECTL